MSNDITNDLFQGFADQLSAGGYGPRQAQDDQTAPSPAFNGDKETFLSSVMPAAQRVGGQLGVDPKLIAAQWGLETGWGKSIIPGTNNLGNIKDFSGNGVLARDNQTGSQDRYKAYNSLDDFADDYAALMQRRYKGTLGAGQDMAKFSEALKAGGYAQDKNYGAKLASALETISNIKVAMAPQQQQPAQTNYATSGGGFYGETPGAVSTDGAFIAGAKQVLPQTKQAAGAIMGMAGDYFDSPGLHDVGYSLYKSGTEDLKKIERPEADIRNVINGNVGLGEYVKYWAGYGGTQLVESAIVSTAAGLVGAGVGSAVPGAGTAVGGFAGFLSGLIGKTAAKDAIVAAGEAAFKEALKKGATQEIAGVAKEQAISQATKSYGVKVLAGLTAGTGQEINNFGLEAGEIYGNYIDESAKRGTPITAEERDKAFWHTLGAASVETLSDLAAIGEFLKEGKKVGSGISGAAKTMGKEALIGLAREVPTEVIQTYLERRGEGKSTTDEDAMWDYANAAGGAAVMGGGTGAATGAHAHFFGEHAQAPATPAAPPVVAPGVTAGTAAKPKQPNSPLTNAANAATAPVAPAVQDIGGGSSNTPLATGSGWGGYESLTSFGNPELDAQAKSVGSWLSDWNNESKLKAIGGNDAIQQARNIWQNIINNDEMPIQTRINALHQATAIVGEIQSGTAVSPHVAQPNFTFGQNDTQAAPGNAFGGQQPAQIEHGAIEGQARPAQGPTLPGRNEAGTSWADQNPEVRDLLGGLQSGAVKDQQAAPGAMPPGVPHVPPVLPSAKSTVAQPATPPSFAEVAGTRPPRDRFADIAKMIADGWRTGPGLTLHNPSTGETLPVKVSEKAFAKNEEKKADTTVAEPATSTVAESATPPEVSPIPQKGGGESVPAAKAVPAYTIQQATNYVKRMNAQHLPSKVIPHPTQQGMYAIVPEDYEGPLESAVASGKDSAKASGEASSEASGKASANASGPASPEVRAQIEQQFAGNKIFTADKVAAARERLKAKLGTLNNGIDPEMLVDGMTIAGGYIESGVRTFSGYSKAMLSDFGNAIKPYLLSFYEAARHYPGIDKEGMTSAEEAAATHKAMMEGKTLDEAAHEAASSPENDLAAPTKGEIKAGNPILGHYVINGLDFSIENPQGSTRWNLDVDKIRALVNGIISNRSNPEASKDSIRPVLAALDLISGKDVTRVEEGFKALEAAINEPDVLRKFPHFAEEASNILEAGWRSKMNHHYGYIKGSIGHDKDHVDAFIKPGTSEHYAGPVYVIDQKNDEGAFDEHKVMIGFDSEQEARDAYLSNYEPGWDGIGAITPMSWDQFKTWVKDPEQTKKAVSYDDSGIVNQEVDKEGPAKTEADAKAAATEWLSKHKTNGTDGKNTFMIGEPPFAKKGEIVVNGPDGFKFKISDLLKTDDEIHAELDAQAEAEVPQASIMNEKVWNAMGYGGRQTIAEASSIGGMRKVVHRIAGSSWSELSEGERTEMVASAEKLDRALTSDAESVEKQKAETRRAAQVDLYNAMSGDEAIMQMAVANDLDHFILGAEGRIVDWLGEQANQAVEDGEMARAEALSQFVANGKPVLPKEFFQSLHEAARKQVAEQKAAQIKDASMEQASKSMAQLQIADQQDVSQFMSGWSHALEGKTKSTLPNGENYAKGYDEARAWMRTDDGKAAFTGKRTKKLENTGADLRRWFDRKKQEIGGDSDEAIIASLDNATVRAELFRDVLPDNPTPGAVRWLEGFRNQVLPFKEWLTERGLLRSNNIDGWYSSKTSGTKVISDYINGETDLFSSRDQTAEQRIEALKDAAQEYVDMVSRVTDVIRGEGTIDGLATALQNFLFKKEDLKNYASVSNFNTEALALARQIFRDWDKSSMKFAKWHSGDSYNLRNLLKNEHKEDDPADRKAALRPPRLDRVDRDGDDFRNGGNITPLEFKKMFGFQDVGFGKWVGARQDQDHLNYSYDAFGDLAKLLNIPPSAISVGGKLHFTIGALGHGKFAAHFTNGQPHPDGGTVSVINVTNTRGDGTVAHEWGHALDLVNQGEISLEIAASGDQVGGEPALARAIKEIKNELRYAYNYDQIAKSVTNMLKGESYWTRNKRAMKSEEGLIDNAKQAIDYYTAPGRQKSAYYQNAIKLDGSNKKDPYWSNDKEIFARAFEAWAGDSLSGTNTYLVNPAWSGDGVITEKTHRGTPYPTEAERQRFNKWFDALAKCLYLDDVTGMLRLDWVKWQEIKPTDRADWNKAMADLEASLPAMMQNIKATKKAESEELAQGVREAASLKVGDVVIGRNIGNFADRFSTPLKIEKIDKDKSGNINITLEIAPGRFVMYSASYFRLVASAEDQAKIEEAAANEAAEQPSTPAEETVGPLSDDDLSKLFDEAAAEFTEETQEEPTAPNPGAAISTLSDGWTQDDIREILKMVKEGKYVFLASDKLGIPTIHDIKGADHVGYGLFIAKGPDYEISFDAGGTMSRTASGQAYTKASVSGTYPYDREAIIKKLEAQLPEKESAPASGGTTLPTLDEKAQATASQMAANAAKLGVKGIDEALTGLVKLFGGGAGRLMSFPGGMDQDTYAAAKPHFEAALKAFQEAGKTIKDLFKYLIQELGMGVKPYAIHFAKEKGLTANLTNETQETGNKAVANYILGELEKGNDIRWQDLFSAADRAFGGTQAEGKYSVKDAYDAMEMGVNLYLRKGNWAANAKDAEAAVRDVKNLARMIETLPTQTKRTAEMDEFQQFSTPPTLSYVANWVANIKAGETMMEPSAGTGDLAIFAENAGAHLILNELSGRRAAILRELFPSARIFTENAEQINNILPADAVPTVVVMNPPFSATAGRIPGQRDTMNGGKHIEQALARLMDGGRLVAIVGEGMAHDRPAFKEWWSKIAKAYNVKANIGISGREYAKYGTTFDNQILVIDKTVPTSTNVITGKVESIADLPALLEGIRNERQEISGTSQNSQSAADQSDSGAVTGKGETSPEPGNPGGSATDAVGPGGRGRGSSQSGRGGNNAPGSGKKSGKADAASDGAGTRVGSDDQSSGEPGRSGVSADHGTAGQSASGVKLGEAEAQVGGELTNSIFEPYRPQRLKIEGAKFHPGDLVQSAAMAAVEPPMPTYTPNLPAEVIKNGLLSDAQIESVVYAGQSHQQILPSGERRGFFIGDGTGVGKGREISGIILDNLRQGRKKAVWISFNKGLIRDAKRDFAGVGADPTKIFFHGDTKASGTITAKDGILFSTYSTLKSSEKKQATEENKKLAKTRLAQIIDWVGPDFDGVIVFDEAHSMGNVLPIKGKRGKSKPSQQAIAGVNLQNELPNARIVYVSATGATEVSNLGYSTRLGLWGEGTPFATAADFVPKISTGGVASMELISRDMKALGMYIARSLSYDGVTYERLDHELSPLQHDIYNELSGAWQIVLQNIQAALAATGQEESPDAKKAAMSRFWGSHQRFFNQIITSMQMPTVVDSIQRNIDAGNAIVIQLTNTNEAEQERQAAKAAAEETPLEELDFTPRQTLFDYIKNGFPVQQYEEKTDEEGNVTSVPALDSAGNPIINREAIAMRDQLLSTLEQIRVPDNPIDMIVNAFGHDQVAEVTGRKRRFVQERDERGSMKVIEQKRGTHASENDASAFQNDQKKILIFSQAGGTGYSFHADKTAKNQRKRIHYIVQPGWRADVAMQGLGRSHRTNQADVPHYVLPTTDLKAQKRFVSSIARRMDQLGALTRGQRETASQGLFTAADNLESKYAEEALETLFNDMFHGKTTMLFNEVTKEMGLGNLVDDSGALKTSAIPEIPKFLNRLLSLSVERQNEVFNEFEKRLNEAVEFAVQQGTYDAGMQTLKAESIKKVRDETAYTDERTGAKTRYVEVDVSNLVKYQTFDKAKQEAQSRGDKFVGWFKRAKDGSVFGLVDLGQRMNEKGELKRRGYTFGIRDAYPRYIENVDELKNGFRYEYTGGRSIKKELTSPLDEAQAAQLWDQQVAEAPKTETTRKRLIVGVILPIWDRIKGHPQIVRLQTNEGERMIGRMVSPKDAKDTLKNLGLGSSVASMAPKDVLAQIKAGGRAVLANGWSIESSRVSNETRLEIKTPGYLSRGDRDLLEQQGAFFERISFADRAFIPTGANELSTFERITKAKPVVELFNKDGDAHGSEDPQFSMGGLQSGQTPESIRAALVSRFGEGIANLEKDGMLQIVADASQIPEHLRNDQAEAVYDPDTGTAWINASRTTVSRAVPVLLHELGEHHGLKDVLGERGWNALGSRVAVMARNKGSLTDRIWNAIKDNYAEFNGVDDKVLAKNERFLHEVIAKLGENAPFRQSSLWKDLVSAIKRFLVKLGFTGHITEQDIGPLVQGSLARLMRDSGGPGPKGGARVDSFEPVMASNKSPWYYSDLARTVPSMSKIADKAGNVSPAQAKAWLLARQKEGKFKKEELEWSGVTDWLDAQEGKVPVSEIEGFVRDNGVQVQEVVLGSGARLPDGWKVVEEKSTDPYRGSTQWVVENEDGEMVGASFVSRQDAIDNAASGTSGRDQSSDTKYHRYQLPGGENYRELLLTLPNLKTVTTGINSRMPAPGYDYKGAFESAMMEKYGGESFPSIYNKLSGSEVDRYEQIIREARQSDSNARTRIASEMTRAHPRFGIEPFNSSHFTQPNILAHIRFNERTDADGRKVLFVEEIQSDWGQKGKKEGFKQRDWDSIDKELSQLQRERSRILEEAAALPDSQMAKFNLLNKQAHEIVEKMRTLRVEQDASLKAVPSAPFVTDTKSWTALALKRVMSYAAENGFDAVAWTNGAQQADRYSLSKQVREIEWVPVSNASTGNTGTHVIIDTDAGLTRFNVNQSGVIESAPNPGVMPPERIVGKKLDEVVGKDMADKIISEKRGKVSGPDLDIGGSGMLGYYDKILPQVANDVLKKVGGGKVEDISISNKGYGISNTDIDEWRIIDESTGDAYGPPVSSREAAQNVVDRLTSSQSGIVITPELRAKVQQGLPLFSQQRENLGLAASSMMELAQEEGLFTLKVSHKSSIDGIMQDVAPEMKYVGETTREDERKETEGDHRYSFKTPSGHDFHVITKDDGTVWLNVADLKEGDGGQKIYWAVANYAYNNRKVFVGDPYGLTPESIVRRTANMLASALRFGTTKHLEPAQQQIWGDVEKGIEPLNWGGRDFDNLKALIHTHVANTLNKFPALANYRYDFANNVYLDKNGQPVDGVRFERAAMLDAARSANAGSKTLRRVIFLRSLLGGSEHEEGLLAEQLHRRPDQVVDGIGPLFSIPTNENPERQFFEAETSPSKWFDSLLNKASASLKGSEKFGWMDKSIHTQLHKAEKNPYFGSVFKRLQHFMSDASRAALRPAELAPTVLPRIDVVSNIGGALKSLIKGKEASADIDAAFKAALNGTLDNVIYKSAEDARLTPRQFEIYREYRDSIDASLEELAASEAWQVARAAFTRDGHLSKEGLELKKASLDNPTEARDILTSKMTALSDTLALRITSLFERAKGEVPFMANGDPEASLRAALKEKKLVNAHMAAVINNVLDVIEERNEIESLLSNIHRVFDRRDELQNQGYAPLMRFGQYYLHITRKDPRTGETVKNEHGEPESEFFGLFETEHERDAAKAAFEEEYKDTPNIDFDYGTMSEEGWRRMKGVNPESVALFAGKLGIDKDEVFQQWYRLAANNRSVLKRLIHRKGTAGFSTDGSRVLASFLTSNGRRSSMLYHVADINEAIEDFPRQQGAEKDEAIKLAEYVQNPQEEAAGPRALMFMHFLGGSVSNFFINATQPAMVTLPYLSQMVGLRRGMALLKDAYKSVNHPERLSDEVAKAMQQAEQEGVVGSQEIFHLWQETARPLVSKMGKYGENAAYRANAFAQIWGMPFAIAEHINRRVTFISAYNAAIENGATKDQAYSTAIGAVNETQFVYGRQNRPNAARGNIGSLVFTFKLFSISYVELLTRMLRGNKEAKRAALYALGILFLAAGMQGVPFADDLDDLIDTIGQLLGYNVSTKDAKRKWLENLAGKEFAQFMLYGLSAWSPLDVSGRMGLGNMIPGTALFKPSNKNKFADVLEIVGPAGGLAKSYVNTLDAVSTGNWSAASTEWMPKAIKDLAKGAEMAATGEAKDSAGRKVADVDLADAFVKMIGFNPQDLATESRKIQGIQQRIDFAKRAESLIAEKWAQGIVSRDPAVTTAARQAVTDFNEKNPDTPIAVRMSNVQRRVKEMQATKEERFIKSASKGMRDQVEADLAE